MQGGLQRIIIGGGSHEVMEIDSIGTVKVGSSSLNGTFELYGGAGEDPAVSIENYFLTGGGQIGINDGSGNMHTQLRTDGNSVGGYLRITRNSAESGFVVDGNYNGTQQPRVAVLGSGRSAVFDMSTSGDNSVLLPGGSITAAEIGDEAGIGSSYAGTGLFGITLSGGYEVFTSRTITVPVAGYVFAIGSVDVILSHTNGMSTSAIFVLSSSDSGPVEPATDLQPRIAGEAPSGGYNIPTTCTCVFSVDAGSFTCYFLANETSGDVRVYDVRLTLIYVSTAYGAVETGGPAVIEEPDGKTVPAMSASEIAAEKEEARRFQMERIERELNELKAQFDRVKSEIERGE